MLFRATTAEKRLIGAREGGGRGNRDEAVVTEAGTQSMEAA